MNNSSEEVHVTTDESIDAVENASEASPLFQQPPSLPIASSIVGLVTGITGTCNNAVVFVVLLFARRHFGSHVNTLITNQSATDLVACIFLIIASILTFPGIPDNYPELGKIGSNLVSCLFRNRVMAVVCMNAEKIGLAVKSCAGLRCGGEILYGF